MSTPFTHLHVASGHSHHHGTTDPATLAAAAASAGASALALTDRGQMAGLIQHVSACRFAGIDPIAGVDLALHSSTRRDSTRTSKPGTTGSGFSAGSGRVVVLAHGHTHGAGWAALCRATTAAHRTNTTPSASAATASLTPADLVAALAPAAGNDPAATVLLGPGTDLGRALATGRMREVIDAWEAWTRLLPASALAVEVVCHLTREGHPASVGVTARVLRAAAAVGIPTVLSNAVRLLHPGDVPTADVGDAVAALRGLEELHAAHALSPNAQAWLKPPHLMEDLAREIATAAGVEHRGRDHAGGLLERTAALAERCRLDLERDLGWGRARVPEPAVLGIDAAATSAGDPHGYAAALGMLRARADAGIGRRHPGASLAKVRAVQERVQAELAVVDRLNYATYFLAVSEATRLIHGLGVRATARGSGVGSVLLWLLGVSNVDPLDQGLLFERFISDRRETLPDIDLDVESARRHDIYRAIRDRFGAERVTLMATTQAYRARGAVRAAGLALGVEPEVVDEVAASLRGVSASRVREAMAELPELRELAELVRSHRQLDLLVDVTATLDRLPRHLSMHPCGVILSDASLLTRTPVQACGIEGMAMSQFDKDDIDPMGWLKLDVLGVRMQSAIAYTLTEIERTAAVPENMQPAHVTPASANPAATAATAPAAGLPALANLVHAYRAPATEAPPAAAPRAEPTAPGAVPDLDAIALDDHATFELIRSTHTLGVFQIESPGQRELLGKFQPRAFSDLVIDVALFRPGPMAGDMISPFLEGHHGWVATGGPRRLPHPDLTPILSETHGVVIFHEQVMRILDVFTGCGLARADVWRRHLSDPDARVEVEADFRTAATARGYPRDVVDAVWKLIAAHGGFGFARAHAAAFAAITYQSAWLKAHYPVQFLTGLLEHDPGMYPRRLLVAEARRLGIAILPVDVQTSTDVWRAELPAPTGQSAGGERRWGIRPPLTVVKDLHAAEVERIVATQPFADVGDFRDRARPRRPTLIRLARLGALDDLAGLDPVLGASLRPGVTYRSSHGSGQGSGRVLTRGDLLAHLQQISTRSKAGRAPGVGAGSGSLPQPRVSPAPLTADAAVTSPQRTALTATRAIQTMAPARPATARATARPAGRFAGWHPGQLVLPLGDLDLASAPAGHLAPTPEQQVSTELASTGMDLQQHILTPHLPELRRRGFTPAERLLEVRTDVDVLVAGVRVATQTPPVRSGRRVVFLTLDDGTGCVDVTVFADVQETTSHHLLYRASLLLVTGQVRRTGPRGVSVRALQLHAMP
ncbi:PHP domain-containing protein [Kineococcus radiotolerans]|uniref:Error-prone DNA polymerase n=1 Tax=Kineococcus radiotolerans (strain ATCC BAA-149 / DSM 14245 / SRS30216) TaxID=266940 RepID=A6WGW8_KINRD|nr:PHP domain-containing protein [Kineococcus radiotolerans]ABS06057.1 DNA polymerase III, alpha subunit [Kineococcus radiotolerans SRS30216 = ATCC BAA-149]